MSIYKILRAGNPLLRKVSKSVPAFDKKVEKLIADLNATLKVQKDPVGVGLAAPQVGKSVRLFLAKIGSNSVVFINPKITWLSKKTNDPSPKAKTRNSKSETRNKLENGKWKMENEEEKEYLMEGCLSLPHYYGPVQRAQAVRVTYQSLTTQKPNNLITHTKIFRGLTAQIIQHEVDHLNGILFIDKLLQQNRKLYEHKGKEWVEVELP